MGWVILGVLLVIVVGALVEIKVLRGFLREVQDLRREVEGLSKSRGPGG